MADYNFRFKSPAESARSIVRDALLYMEMQAKTNVPQRTGNLFRSISKEGPNRVGVLGEYAGILSAGGSATAPYAEGVEKGTGLYGPRRKYIRPLTGNFLVWEESGRRIFARRVKGQEGQYYMERAFIETRDVFLPARLLLEGKKLASLD